MGCSKRASGYKKTDVKLHNVKYILLVSIFFCNLCTGMKDSSKPQWRLNVKKFHLKDFIFNRQEDKKKSNDINKKIAEWIWEHTKWLSIII